MLLKARTGHGTVLHDGTFNDVVETISREPSGNRITYKGKRYRLGGGIRTDYFINLDNPIKRRS